ncbi:MAG: efflux RND transporter periplasmic adaptor subunit [Bacteroidia bacterium]
MKKILILIGIGIAAIAFTLSLKSCSNDNLLKVTTEKAQKRNIIETVSANGKIQPETEVKISPDVSGEIVALQVKEGDQVMKGDLLLKIRPDIYESTLDQMTASLNNAKANLANSKARLTQMQAQFVNAQAIYDRNQKLFSQDAISASDWDAAKAAYAGAKADVSAADETVKAAEFSVKSSAASVNEAQDNLIKTTIVAPVTGTVYNLAIEKGERVVGTSQMAGTQMLCIANLNKMEANVNVNENDIVRVHLGDTALIEVDAFLDRKFKGIVTEIANSANTTGVTADQVTNFSVKIRILEKSYADLLAKNGGTPPFRPGMSATVDIETKSSNNVLSVPIESVTTRNNNATADEKTGDTSDKTDNSKTKSAPKTNAQIQECVFVFSNGKAKMVNVKTGIQDNNFIEITEGLKDSDEVITGPYESVSKVLKDGSSVEKASKINLFKDTATK